MLSNCATYNKQVSHESALEYPNNKVLAHRFYLVGDAGNTKHNAANVTLEALQSKLQAEGENTTVLFLGDNVYPNGMPKETSEKSALAGYRLKLQTDLGKTFKGKTVFIPGNHDWYSNGLKGLKRQQEFVENELGKNSFLPKDGCPIKTRDIDENSVVIYVDSQWYVTNWDKHPTINDDCEIKTRHEFLEEFRSEIKKARGKTTLVAIHHPMFSNGPHSGEYDLNSHLKPLPVLGSLKNLIRKTSGISNADLQNKFYNELQQNLVTAAKQNDKVIFVSGHDHSLQYLVENNIPQIISGAGSKTSATKLNKGGKFAYGVQGYAVLDVFTDGASFVQFISSDQNTVEYKTAVLNKDIEVVQDTFNTIDADSISSTIYTPAETRKNKVYEFLWGKRYRKQYSTPVKAKTVRLDTLFGGVTPIRKGGGTQSVSLRLETKGGKQYVMRAVRKNAVQYLQAAFFKNKYIEDDFQNTKSAALILDIFTGAHPYAPLTIAKLSDAAGIYHTNPQLLYVPKQKALGRFNTDFGNELYLVEEHGSDGHFNLAGEHFTGGIISTQDVLEEIHADEDIVVDQESYIKARLFDMLIGDWDRHQDQWRWLEFKENNKTVYRPLPRDRDQVFSKMSDGFLLGTAVKALPAAKLLRKYENDLKDVKGFNVEPFPLDMALITSADKSVWDEQVNSITQGITDAVIDKAFEDIPKEVQDQDIVKIKDILKNRRANLQKIADRYFKLINKVAVIKGTNKDDYIKINSEKDGTVAVSIFRKKGDAYTDRFHYKKYDPKLTKEIWIYALDDEDTFEVFGKSKQIKIRLIGGQNHDDYTVENGKNIVIYDYKTKKNTIDQAKKASLRLNDHYETNVYDYNKLKNNTNQVLPILGANPDDGLKIGFSNLYTRYGFERNPFTSQHKINAAYYFATNGYELAYTGEFAHVIHNLNLVIDSEFQSSNFSLNFFGYGNETPNSDDELGLNYNRVKVRGLKLAPSLTWKGHLGAVIGLGASYESVEVSETRNRFVENNALLPHYIFDEVQFVGVHASYLFQNYDVKDYPTIGMKTALNLGYKSNLDIKNRSFGYLIPEISFTHHLNPSKKLVLATKLRSHFIFGHDFEFYQAASIGGENGLRGYRNQRFSGKNSFYQNTDIRYSFSNLKTSVVPIRIGLYGGFDYGRVWMEHDTSSKWNNSYGGGVFVTGAEMLSLNLGVFNSADGVRASFLLGFQF
ncbi:metallophosphoesterase [Mariniflexile ostreae]|uniref:Metallophosphoesterase n=2 Tax=Mariniflexile ostreae TaxID=1520892 RepID=A0ABV5FBD8_9FLAO